MRKKLINWLFPPAPQLVPPPPDPTLRGSLEVVTDIEVGWRDLARLIASRRAKVKTFSRTQRDPGASVTNGVFWVAVGEPRKAEQLRKVMR
jgi:hypothetical protein